MIIKRHRHPFVRSSQLSGGGGRNWAKVLTGGKIPPHPLGAATGWEEKVLNVDSLIWIPETETTCISSNLKSNFSVLYSGSCA